MLVDLLKYYSSKGVISDNQGSISCNLLYESCECSKECWAGLEDKKAEWNKIQFPFVGPKYFSQKKKILVVGLNLNEYGGHDSLINLAMDAQYALLNHWQKIRFGNTYDNYRGSIFWHRVALYSAIILSAQELHLLSDDMLTDFENLSRVMEKISFIEAVKCSPYDKESESSPSTVMKINCTSNFLLQEIHELSPDCLIIMGKETLNVPGNIEQEFISKSENGNIDLSQIKIGEKLIPVYTVIHPTAIGGNNTEIGREFKGLVEATLKHLR
jgi:hypothetical protein